MLVQLRSDRARLTLIAMSVALVLVDLALVGVGVWLLLTATIPVRIVGVLLILLGLELRPRVGKIRLDGRISADEQPELFELIEQVRGTLDAPPIDAVLINNDFNAACARSGWRRRSVLMIGLPL